VNFDARVNLLNLSFYQTAVKAVAESAAAAAAAVTVAMVTVLVAYQ